MKMMRWDWGRELEIDPDDCWPVPLCVALLLPSTLHRKGRAKYERVSSDV